MSSLFPRTPIAVAARRMLVKRPWIHWLVVAVAAAGAGGSMLERADRVDAARNAWGETGRVWVAVADHAPGDPLAVERREVPLAMIPEGAVETVDGLTARQRVAAGEIVHTADVVALSGPQSLTPVGWLAVPVNESPPSGAALGDRVRVVADGVVLSADAIVVGHHDGASLIAVPSDDAPPIAALGTGEGVTLLLIP